MPCLRRVLAVLVSAARRRRAEAPTTHLVCVLHLLEFLQYTYGMTETSSFTDAARTLADAIEAAPLDKFFFHAMYTGPGAPEHDEAKGRRPLTTPELRAVLAPIVAELRAVADDGLAAELSYSTMQFLKAKGLEIRPNWSLAGWTPLDGALRAAAWHWADAYDYASDDQERSADSLATALAELAKLS